MPSLVGLTWSASSARAAATGLHLVLTPDPSQANNTASASEASQPAPIAAPVTFAPGSNDPVDICADPPVTETFDGAAVNAVNPSAPPPNPATPPAT